MSSISFRATSRRKAGVERAVPWGRYGTLATLTLSLSALASGSAVADVHRVSWHANDEYRIEASEASATVSLTHGFTVEGDTWPSRVVRVELPPNGTISSVRVIPVREAPLAADIEILTPSSLTVGIEDVTPEQSAGYTVRVLPEGDFLGHRIGHVLVSPFRASGDTAYFLSDFELDIDVVEGSGDPDATLSRRISHPRTDAADMRALRALLDSEPRPFTPAGESQRTTVPPELTPETTELIVVTPDAFVSTMQEFADFKTKEGIPARVVSTEWIFANYAGIDLAARIRDYVRDVYLYQGLRYVVLAGDTDQVPSRKALSRFQDSSGIDIISDKYYACLDGNWNDDGDNQMGEAPDTVGGEPGDSVDLYPEVSVGRVPVSSVADAATYVAKWKSYTGYDPGNFRTDYQKRVLALAEVLFPDDWEPTDDPGDIIIDGADIAEETLDHFPPGWDITRLYQYSENPMHPTSEPETRERAIEEINEGYGIVDHVGHGFRANMSVGAGKLVNADADAFTNTNAYSVLYAVNCSSGAVLYDCINEHMIENDSGGIIASIAATDLDYPSISDAFKFEFFRLLFDEDVTAIGDAFQGADLPWIPIAVVNENAYRWTVMTLTCLGDPSLNIWRDTPRNLALSFPTSYELGVQSLTVNVTETGSPVEGVRVTAWKDDGYAVGFTDVSGNAVLAFAPESEGAFTVTAVKSDFVPEIDSGSVVASSTAALRITNLIYHDGDGAGIGNGDGRPDAGERVVIDMTVRNDGTTSATGITADLTTNSTFVTALDASAVVPDLTAGAESTVLAAFEVDITTALPDSVRHITAPTEIALASAEGNWLDEMPINVYQRLLDIVKLDWVIVGDDGDGIVEAGETVDVTLTAVNRGEAVARGVVGVASFGGSDFVVTNDTVAFGDMAPGDEVTAGTFSFLSAGGSQLTLLFDVTLSDVYAAADLLVRASDILAPAPPDSLWAEPAARSVRVVWPLPTTGSTTVRGYRVLRSDTPGGTFDEVSDDIVEDGTFFVDEGLTPLSQYVYKVIAIDWAGNESDPTGELVTTTSPPVLEGWPVPLPSGESKGSPTIANVDRQGELEIALGWSYPMVFQGNGGDFVDGDNDAQTAGVFSDIGGGASQFWNSPFVYDVDRDNINEIAYCYWQDPVDNKGYLYLIDATGAIEPGWPQEIGRNPWGSPAVADLDGDGFYEIVLTSGEGNGPLQGTVLAWNHDGTEFIDGDSDPGTTGVFYEAGPDAKFWYGSVAIGDLDGDDADEVVLMEKRRHASPSEGQVVALDADGSFLPGFPYDFGGTLRGSTSSPAIADLDDNGDLEIIAACDNGLVVLNHTGTPFSSFPYTLPEIPASQTGIRDFLSSPAIGDIDDDGDLDIALGWLDGEVYAWDANSATLLPGFPATMPVQGSQTDQYLRSPILGNLNGSPEPEIIISSGPNKLFAVDYTGALISGFPLTLQGGVFGSTAVSDVNGDGFVNLVVQTNAPELTIYSFETVPYVRTEHPWPMFRHNTRKDGLYTPRTAVDVENGPQSAPIAATAFPPTPNPFSPRVDLPFAVPAGGDEVTVRVFDVTGREVRTLADGNFPAGEFRLSWDGRTATGRRLSPGQYFATIQIGAKRFTQKLTLLR